METQSSGQKNIQFPSLREAVTSCIFKVKQFIVKRVRRQYLHMQVYLYFACVPV